MIALLDGLTIARRNLLYLKHSPGIVAAALATPVLMVVLFGYVFGSAIPVPGAAGGYREYLVPGLFAMIAVNGVMPGMVGMARDRERGVSDRLRSMPIVRSAVPFGYLGSDIVLGVLVLGVMAATGLAVGWRARDGLGPALAAFGILVLFRYACSWAGMWVGMAVSSEQVANQLTVALFPISFLTNAFVPVDGMPAWLRAICTWNPISAVVAACRTLFGNAPAPPRGAAWPLAHPVAASLTWSVLLLAVFVPLATRRFARPD